MGFFLFILNDFKKWPGKNKCQFFGVFLFEFDSFIFTFYLSTSISFMKKPQEKAMQFGNVFIYLHFDFKNF